MPTIKPTVPYNEFVELRDDVHKLTASVNLALRILGGLAGLSEEQILLELEAERTALKNSPPNSILEINESKCVAYNNSNRVENKSTRSKSDKKRTVRTDKVLATIADVEIVDVVTSKKDTMSNSGSKVKRKPLINDNSSEPKKTKIPEKTDVAVVQSNLVTNLHDDAKIADTNARVTSPAVSLSMIDKECIETNNLINRLISNEVSVDIEFVKMEAVEEPEFIITDTHTVTEVPTVDTSAPLKCELFDPLNSPGGKDTSRSEFLTGDVMSNDENLHWVMAPPLKRKKWDQNMMYLAVEAVRSGEMGYKRASKNFNVPKGTLERYVKDKDNTPKSLVEVSLGRKPVLSKQVEDLLVKYCLDMDARFYGLRRKDITRMAFQLALKNGLKHPFSEGKNCAGKKWLKGFFKRHPQLSLQKPQGTSFARVKGCSPENVKRFFELYEPQLLKIKSQPHRLYNVGETGITVVQHKVSKVITLKKEKSMGSLTSAERGKLITVVACMNAVGSYVPPLIVWSRKHMNEDLMDGTPSGSIYACHPSGCIQPDMFTMWFEHFMKHVKPSQEDPVLLVLDGHSSHNTNLNVIDKARENHVTIVCLPPHSSHKMQPLDVGFLIPLKRYYAEAIEYCLHNNPGKVVTDLKVGKLFGRAYNRAATMNNSVNAFKKTGLFPINKNSFHGHDFPIHDSEPQDNAKELQDNVKEPQYNAKEPQPSCSTST